MPNENLNPSVDPDVELWLSEIRDLYGKDHADDFKVEAPFLKRFLLKLKVETREKGRLSICKLEHPLKRGGSSVVFKAHHTFIPDHQIALKIGRPKEDCIERMRNEIAILTQLDHSNIVRVIDAGELETTEDEAFPLLFIMEPFISGVTPLNKFAESLNYEKEKIVNKSMLDLSLINLVSTIRQWFEALVYVHQQGFVYVDLKPENAIIDKDGHVLIIDFGSAVKIDEKDDNPIEVVITDGYADPEITRHIMRSTTPERLKSSVRRRILTPKIDYFALGQSVMELLDIVSKKHPHDFPQRPLFQSLYFLATRLLNGKNQEKPRDNSRHSLREIYPGLFRADYETIHYERLSDALRDIKKEDGSWALEKKVPELETYPKESIRFVPNMNTALTDRLRAILEHPLVARLKLVSQLGLISLVYPPADHSRYDHILGAFTYASSYIRSLFYDPYNCLFRNLVDEKDIKAALLASIIHDLGQYPLAHDLQEVCSDIFDHTNLSIDLLSDQTRDNKNRTLLNIIEDPNEGWGIDIGTLKRILGARSENLDIWGIDVVDFKADMLSALINGPIDADKADYITRDSTNCRIPYGKQLDIERLLMVLTTVRIPEHLQKTHKVTIGVYEKGRASASAFSLARYLLYASVYWEHASRIIKAMLQYGAVLALPSDVFYDSKDKIKQIHEQLLSFVKELIPPFEEEQKEETPSEQMVPDKQVVETEPSPDVLKTLMKARNELSDQEETGWYPGISITDRLMLKWIKAFATDDKGFRGVKLIDMILERRLYKRLYTIERVDSNNELLGKLDTMEWPNRLKLCEQLQDNLHQIIKLREKELDTVPLTSPNERDMLFANNLVILVDIPDPKKYTESYRPLMYQQELQRKTYYQDDVTPIEDKNLSNAIESLMKSIAPVRILCHPDVLQWIRASKISPMETRKIIEKALGIGN